MYSGENTVCTKTWLYDYLSLHLHHLALSNSTTLPRCLWVLCLWRRYEEVLPPYIARKVHPSVDRVGTVAYGRQISQSQRLP